MLQPAIQQLTFLAHSVCYCLYITCECPVQRAANALLGIRTEHIARLDLALIEAFELLNSVSFRSQIVLVDCTAVSL